MITLSKAVFDFRLIFQYLDWEIKNMDTIEESMHATVMSLFYAIGLCK